MAFCKFNDTSNKLCFSASLTIHQIYYVINQLSKFNVGLDSRYQGDLIVFLLGRGISLAEVLV